MKKKQSFIVEFWDKIFLFFGKISVFNFLRWFFPKLKGNYNFVEYYVIFNTTLSILTLLIFSHGIGKANTLIVLLLAVYGFIRTCEIIIYQVNVLLFDQFRAADKNIVYTLKGYRRMLILLIHNYFEITCWFGVSYLRFLVEKDIDFQHNLSFIQMFHESLALMLTFIPRRCTAANEFGLTLFSIQALIGLFMTLIMFARFLSLLPVPGTKDSLEKRIR